ncbi:hypothetical protein JCM13591A_29970 [Microbacterium xylanilyticum]
MTRAARRGGSMPCARRRTRKRSSRRRADPRARQGARNDLKSTSGSRDPKVEVRPRDIAAEAIGMGEASYRRMKTLVTTATDETQPIETREAAREAVENIDTGAQILQRRAENALGIALRDGQADGSIRSQGMGNVHAPGVAGSTKGTSATGTEVPASPYDFATHAELYGNTRNGSGNGIREGQAPACHFGGIIPATSRSASASASAWRPLRSPRARW